MEDDLKRIVTIVLGMIVFVFLALSAIAVFSSGRNRSIAIFRGTRNGVRPISGANNGATAIAFGGPRPSRRALRSAPGLPQ